MARPMTQDEGWETVRPVGGSTVPRSARPAGSAPGGRYDTRRTPPPARPGVRPLADDAFASVQPVGYRERMAFAQEYTRPQEVLVPSPFAGTEDFVPRRQVMQPTGSTPVQQHTQRQMMPPVPRGAAPRPPQHQAVHGPVAQHQPMPQGAHGSAMQPPQRKLLPMPGGAAGPQQAPHPRQAEPQTHALPGYPPQAAPLQNTSRRPLQETFAMPAAPAAGEVDKLLRKESEEQVRQNRPAQETPRPADLPPEEQHSEAGERARRSKALMKKQGPFWDPVGAEAKREADKRARALRKRRMHVCRNVLIFLTVALLSVLLVRGAVFSVRSMQVSGNSGLSDAAILAEAGLKMGMSQFDVDEESVRAQVNSNRYLEFISLRQDWPDGVTLFVRERMKTATMDYCGMVYFLAGDGMVLEESADIDADWSLPKVRGLEPKTVKVGKKLTGSASAQVRAYCTIISELKEQGCLSIIRELNLGDMDNIYLVTTEDYSVHLGQVSDIRAKIGAMRAVRDSRMADDWTGGTIDVCTPVNPIYSPE